MSDTDARLEALLATLFQAHPWHGVPAESEAPGVLNAYIELVPTDTVKYELDKRSGHMRLDRPQQFSSLCPMLYGFVPQTYCAEQVAARCMSATGITAIEGDGDPLDVCVITEKATAHGNFFAHVRPIGGLRMVDGNQADDKIVAVLSADVAFGHIERVEDCPEGLIERLQHYFLSYKQRPGNPSHRVQIAEVYGQAEALEVIAHSQADYRAHFGQPHSRLAELRTLLRA